MNENGERKMQKRFWDIPSAAVQAGYSSRHFRRIIEEDGIRLYDKRDIAAMKLFAFSRRGLRRDFVDLFFLLKEYSIQEMIGFFRKKFPSVEPLLVALDDCFHHVLHSDNAPISGIRKRAGPSSIIPDTAAPRDTGKGSKQRESLTVCRPSAHR